MNSNPRQGLAALLQMVLFPLAVPAWAGTVAPLGLPPAAGAPASPVGATPTVQAMPVFTVVGRSNRVFWANRSLDKARDRDLLPKTGATQYGFDRKALQALPQGRDTPLDKALLQAPGVSYDSAISDPDFHVRNEYANVQYRLDGIVLPDGVSALGPILETGFIGSMKLLDGALPAEYGLRTAGVVDITTRSRYDDGASLDLVAGSWGTFSEGLQVGGTAGRTQYFAMARSLESQQGLENAMPTPNPIHDATQQGRAFGYTSTLLNPDTRLISVAGAFAGSFQIPDVAGQVPLGDYGSPTADSASLNENETDQFYFAMLALQARSGRGGYQVSADAREASTLFLPDLVGDLEYNDVASKVSRQSGLGGLQADADRRLGFGDTLRVGLDLSVEATRVFDQATVLPLGPSGAPLPDPVTVLDGCTGQGVNAGGYVQDAWSPAPAWTLNAGLRFDALRQFVVADQWSPRAALEYRGPRGLLAHAGYARTFTPPMLAQSTPSDLALFAGTTQQSEIPQDDPVLPERADVYDAGVDGTLAKGWTAGVDAYLKESADTLDDGQFGQAVVLDQFNWARGMSRGVELKSAYGAGGLEVYGNYAHEITRVEQVVSNQYVIGDPAELAYFQGHWVPSSDAQTDSASFGASYRWGRLLADFDGIAGSGLPEGFANLQNVPAYVQCNASVACAFRPWGGKDPLTLRLSCVNVFDRSYLLRPGTGVGEFAPQYGPRRGVFTQCTQDF